MTLPFTLKQTHFIDSNFGFLIGASLFLLLKYQWDVIFQMCSDSLACWSMMMSLSISMFYSFVCFAFTSVTNSTRVHLEVSRHSEINPTWICLFDLHHSLNELPYLPKPTKLYKEKHGFLNDSGVNHLTKFVCHWTVCAGVEPGFLLYKSFVILEHLNWTQTDMQAGNIHYSSRVACFFLMLFAICSISSNKGCFFIAQGENSPDSLMNMLSENH